MTNDMNCIKALLFTKEPNEPNWQTRGEEFFSTVPRIGEVIKLEKDREYYLYKVVCIKHVGSMQPLNSIEPNELYSIEIYTAFMGSEDEFIAELFEASNLPESNKNSAAWINDI